MSDVEAVSSLPATALDVGPGPLAVKVNDEALPAPPSPKKASPPPPPPPDDDPPGSQREEEEQQQQKNVSQDDKNNNNNNNNNKTDPTGDDHPEDPSSPKADSEAETIIQSGRESLSPEKRRKYINHDPKRRDDVDDDGNEPVGPAVEGDLPPNDLQVRKRKGSIGSQEDPVPAHDAAARPPSSLPPPREPSPSVVKMENPEESSQPFAGKRETSHARGGSEPKSERMRASRKRSFSESVDGDEDGYRRVRQTPAVGSRDRGRKDAPDPVNGTPSFARPASHDRSVSPVRHAHKRTASGPQLGGGGSSSSDIHRKRKAQTPLLTGFQRQTSEDRQSISSSTSGSPHPSAHMRKLTSFDGASASPARPMGHKKQRDQNGRTRLARACAAQELEVAMAKHAERPDDLNVPDNAGNTPLQIASLEGSAPIVRFLLDAGCEIDTKNIDKDTPLIDAVENGHLDVIKLLLEAGANPRTVNAEGDEPYELVPSDCDEYAEIRRIITDAKANRRPGRRSEERSGTTSSRGIHSRRASGASPRDSPPVPGPRSPPLFGAAAAAAPSSKRKSVRSEVTRNDLLWTKATPQNLQMFAAKGDMAGVANILNVGQKADPESMIAAAKGGHDEVLSLMLGMGFADPDPDPVDSPSQKVGFNTPMLAAIGKGNLAVIRLLLDQPGFNATRRLFRDRAYYELASDRRGENFEEEAKLLRDAYDKQAKTKKSRKADLTSPRRARDKERESRKSVRKNSPSPAAHRDSSSKDAGLPKEKRRDAPPSNKDNKSVSNISRSKISHREGSDNPTSDPDASRSDAPRRKAESPVTSRGDDARKRRRLIAGRPPKDNRDRRRPSLLSSDSLSGREESTSKPRVEKPSEDINKPLKRARHSESPDGSRSRGTDSGRLSHDTQKKKRRVLSEDGAPNVSNGGTKKGADSNHKNPTSLPTDIGRDASQKQDTPSKGATGNKTAADRSPVKQETEKEGRDLEDIPMEDEPQNTGPSKAESEAAAERQRLEAKKAEEERLAEEKRLAAEAEAERAQAAKEEEERAAKLAQEKAEEEERKRIREAEEEERKRKEAEQRRIKQAEDERLKRLEQERLRLAKLRREQEEQEQRRRDALPSRLRVAANLVGSNDPRARSHLWLRKFMPVVTAQTKQLDPSSGPEVSDEKWVPNYLIAPLLATNDLQLSQYASWEKRNATPTQRMNLWRVTRRMLVEAEETEFQSSSFGQVMQKDCETRPKYFDMEHVFWVRLSDFMDLVPHIPHLHGLDIQFLRMHIDQEPTFQPPMFELPQPNGHPFGSPPTDDVNGHSAGTKGLTNGYGHGHPRPSTYV